MSNDEKQSLRNEETEREEKKKEDDSVKQPASVGIQLAKIVLGYIGGGVAGSVLVLVAFGFLSDFSHYRFAGVPRLHFDYTATVEAGALALIQTLTDSVYYAINDQTELVFGTSAAIVSVLVVLLLFAYLIKSARQAFLMLAQGFLCIMVIFQLVGFVKLSSLVNLERRASIGFDSKRIFLEREYFGKSSRTLGNLDKTITLDLYTSGDILIQPREEILNTEGMSKVEIEQASQTMGSGYALRRPEQHMYTSALYGCCSIQLLLTTLLTVVCIQFRRRNSSINSEATQGHDDNDVAEGEEVEEKQTESSDDIVLLQNDEYPS